MSYSFNSIFGDYKEPNIVKAQFIISPSRIYTLEFDQNISMNELKMMIQKAAHLSKINFRLISNGEEYTNYNEETFESLFGGQKLVVFNLELKLGEDYDETELLLQMNCSCNIHIDKFLLYYCFTCGESICSDCFIKGKHQGHKFQEKCFYLLPTKFLVDKLFENWSHYNYDEYKFTEDQTLAELRTNINKMIFEKLFEILNNIKIKITNIIEKYHHINYQSFDKVRNSIRDIKIYCIKILDDLKEKMNIKDIINNEQLYLDFDKAYKKLDRLKNEKFNSIFSSYIKFNEQIPTLIKNMINDINNKLLLNLNQIANDQRYDIILNQINIKSVKTFNQEEITNEILKHIKPKYSDFTKKRLTLNYKYDNYENIKDYSNKRQGKKTIGPDYLYSNHLNLNNNINNEFSNINNNLLNSGSKNKNKIKETNFNIKDNKKYPNLFINNNKDIFNNHNYNMSNNFNNINLNSYSNSISNNINNNISLKKDENIKEKGKIISTTTTTILEKKINGIPSVNIKTGNIQSDIVINSASKKNNINFNENNKKDNYSSAQPSRKTIQNSGMFFNSINLPIINSEIQNNKQAINLNNTLNDSFSSNSTIKNINQMAEDNLNNNKYINNINNQKNISPFTSTNTEIENKTISSYINNNNNINKKNPLFYTFGVNNVIGEENIESENETNVASGIIKKLTNKDFILAPITQTKNIKIITSEKDEATISVNFSNNLDIDLFLLECAYCNYNKILYITGGIKDNKKTNIALSINLNKKEEQICKLSSMNFYRACHSMISYGKYLFVVGGDNQSTVERYNIIDNIWEKLCPMNYVRMYPILVIYNEYLYSLFGKTNENEYCNTIERLRLCNRMEKEKWEMIQFNNQNNIDTRLYGCAVCIVDNNLYLLGGKCNEKTTNEILYFDFEKNILRKESSKLSMKESFRENNLHKMGDKLVQIVDGTFCGTYLQFS